MRPLGAYLRSLDPRLPRVVYVLQGGGLLNAFGNGVVLPFLIIYLHNVRGIPLGLANFKLIPVTLTPFGREIVDPDQAARLGYGPGVGVPS